MLRRFAQFVIYIRMSRLNSYVCVSNVRICETLCLRGLQNVAGVICILNDPQYVEEMSSKAQQKAGMMLLGGALHEAEAILLHNGMVFQAIYNNIQLHNWSRALDLAIKHKTHIDTVLYLREKYLKALGKAENNNKFNTIKESVQIDEEKVRQKLETEFQKNKMGNQNK